MLIGIGITIVFICLTRLPYIGRLLQAGLGLVWGRIVYAFLDGVFHYKYSDIGLMTGLYENDKILWWAIVIIINLIFIAIHIAAFSNHMLKEHDIPADIVIDANGKFKCLYEAKNAEALKIIKSEVKETVKSVSKDIEISKQQDNKFTISDIFSCKGTF